MPKTVSFNGVKYPPTGSPVSLKAIDDSPPKMTKIHSLFDNRSVKQIAESQIFTINNEECLHILSTKKIAEGMVISTIVEEPGVGAVQDATRIKLADF